MKNIHRTRQCLHFLIPIIAIYSESRQMQKNPYYLREKFIILDIYMVQIHNHLCAHSWWPFSNYLSHPPPKSFKISKADNGLLFSKAKYELKSFTSLESYPS